MTGLWYREVFRDQLSLGVRVERTLHASESAFQRIEIVETPFFGKMLVLDGIFMTSEADEHYYHEMIVHPALCTAPRIARVLIIGGGDGGTAREVLRHPDVERCTMVEIDHAVVEACKAHLPEIGREGWDDPRLELRFEDGIEFVKRAPAGSFDVVILDGSDPVGPAEGLFDRSFYEGVKRVLGDGGVFALQSESPTVYEKVFYEIQATLRGVFGASHPYFGSVTLYGSGMWTWTMTGADPSQLRPERAAAVAERCRYWSPEIHRAAFAQPAEIARQLQALASS